MQTFDIYFLGETLPDSDQATVRTGVARLFKMQDSAVDRLFSGKPIRVKQAVDADAASRYRAAFRDVGALIQIVPAGSAPPAANAPGAAAAAAPAKTAARPPSVDAPTPSGASGVADLAEPGAILDHTPPPPPADIDTGSLEALPPNSGSLEDCRQDKPPRPIPDISHLRLVDD
jgi:hypothetical protein